MSSKEEASADERLQNTMVENSEGGTTMAIQKKRARRVSFAENTSIRFFDRDEEYNETPSTETGKIGDDFAGGFVTQPEHSKGFEGEDEDGEEMDVQRSFLRPIGSPSPGGSTFGSASSNDEDNFFGPVSANFIRPRRLSDSAASDDNHDVTMDSTAFSMHFRSLARSESEVDLKTPTGGELSFEKRMPLDANKGSSMVFTLGKKLISNSSMPVTKVSDTRDSNDMSLVGENLNKYDYEKLSPGLDALLAESRKSLLSVSVCDDIIASEVPKGLEKEVLLSNDHGNAFVKLSNFVRKGGRDYSQGLLNGEVFAACSKLDNEDGFLGTFPNFCSPKTFPPSTIGAMMSDISDHKLNGSPYQLSKNESETPLVVATSPVEQQGHLNNSSPSQHLELVTPLCEQPCSSRRSECVEHHDIETSIQKSISKLESLEKSALYSAFSAKIDKSTIKSLKFFNTPPLDTFLEKNRHVSQINFVEDSVTEEELDSVIHSKDKRYAFKTDDNRAETLNPISDENHMEEFLGHGTLPNDLSFRNFSADEPDHRRTAVSPAMARSGDNINIGLLTSKYSIESAVMTETESLWAKVASRGGKVNVTDTKFVSSPGKMLEKKLSASPGLQSSKYKTLLLQDQHKRFLDFDKGWYLAPERNPIDANLSVATATTVSMGMKGDVSSPVEVIHLKNLIEVNATADREVAIYNQKEVSGTIDNCMTPVKDEKSHVMYSKIPEGGIQTSSDISGYEDNLPEEEFRAVSPFALRNIDEPILQNLVEFPREISRKKLGNKLLSTVPSPKSIQLSGGLENFSARKRNIELMLRDKHVTETTATQKSPKLKKGGTCDTETMEYPNGSTVTSYEKSHWTDMYSTFSVDTKKLISQSAHELDAKMIDVLEDMLVHRQRLQIYETLHAGILPQNKVVLHYLQLERIAETNLLLSQIVFEKAKLQLKHVKRERLLKRLQLLGSRAQVLQTLSTDLPLHPLKIYNNNVMVDASGDQSPSINLNKGHEVCHEKLTIMRQALEASGREILNLKRSFHARCKITAEPSCCNTLALVNEHLMKRAGCRFIRLDMQMWVVHMVGIVDGQQIIVLDYLGFIVQSMKVIIGPTSSAAISFKVNEMNIVKNFPNMDVCTAFAFVFNGERTRKYIGAKTLVQETQVTSSFLGTLLDVVEEVQLAQMELQNLIQSSFCSPSVEQLDLKLCFFNFNTGKKVILTLDLCCLKSGIYPLEILPLQFGSQADGTSLGPIFGEIKDAIKSVKSGYTRILRLCRCVSQVVQASSV